LFLGKAAYLGLRSLFRCLEWGDIEAGFLPIGNKQLFGLAPDLGACSKCGCLGPVAVWGGVFSRRRAASIAENAALLSASVNCVMARLLLIEQ
jgi:hypothetical protein